MTGDLPVVCPYVENSVKTAVRATSPARGPLCSSVLHSRTEVQIATEAALTSEWTVFPELWDVHVIPAFWELRGERFLLLRSWSPGYVKIRKGKRRS